MLRRLVLLLRFGLELLLRRSLLLRGLSRLRDRLLPSPLLRGGRLLLDAGRRHRPAHRDELLSGAIVAEFGDPPLQSRIRARIGDDIRAELRILIRDLCQEHRIGVRILHGRHRGIEIDHCDLLISWSVTIVVNDLS